jgi:hypothetical protein
MFAAMNSDINPLKSGLLHLTSRRVDQQKSKMELFWKLIFLELSQLIDIFGTNQASSVYL